MRPGAVFQREQPGLANIAAIVAFCIVFATNYIVHICMYGQNAMSQNFLFTTYALLVWLSILWHQTHKTKHALLLAVICGITILSRPSEIICLMIPVLWGVKSIASLIEKTKHLLKHKWQLIAFAFIIIAFGMMQFGYWKLFAGKFLFNSYGGNAGEGFEFKHPYIWEVLFSFRKGWLLYTPIMLFALAGFYFMYKQNRSIFYALFVYLILNIYIVSSWSCWWYAQSFSQRALIPSYPIMAIALGYFLTWISQQKTITKLIAYVAISVCVILNIFQTIQFHKGIISGDSMTKAYYCATFGKLSTDANLKKLLLVNRLFGGREVFSNKNDYSLRMFKKFDFEDVQNHDSTFYRSGRFAAKLDSINIYTPAVEAPYCEITEKDHAWIRITAYVYPTNDTLSAPFSLVVYFDHNNYAYKYFTYDSRMMKLELNKWNKIVFDYLSPEVRNKNDKLMLYFWNRGKGNVYIDDMQVEIFEEK